MQKSSLSFFRRSNYVLRLCVEVAGNHQNNMSTIYRFVRLAFFYVKPIINKMPPEPTTTQQMSTQCQRWQIWSGPQQNIHISFRRIDNLSCLLSRALKVKAVYDPYYGFLLQEAGFRPTHCQADHKTSNEPHHPQVSSCSKPKTLNLELAGPTLELAG